MSALSRRRFLQRVGLAGAASSAVSLFPWLRVNAQSASATPVPKLLLFYTPHGTVWDDWRPITEAGGETGYTFSPILEPLTAHRERMVIVDGVEMISGTDYYIPHTYTMPLLWTGSPIDTGGSSFCREDHGGRCFGWNTGISIDQHIAATRMDAVPYPTIELGYQCGGLHPATRMIYGTLGSPKSPIDDPARAFDTLFGTVDPDMEVAARDALRRRSVLDAVVSDIGSWRGKLSGADRDRLDAHATAVRDMERSLVPPDVVCEQPTSPIDISAETAIDRQSALAASALGCGLSNIVSIQTRIADNDNSLYPWVGLTEGGHHTLSHDSGVDAQTTLSQVYRWYAGRFAYLLDRLAATPDVDGSSVLDNTLVIWGSELGRGWDHDISNVPFLFAGAASKLRGGRYLQVATPRANRVLVTAAQWMGLDLDSFGSLDNSTGPLIGVLK